MSSAAPVSTDPMNCGRLERRQSSQIPVSAIRPLLRCLPNYPTALLPMLRRSPAFQNKDASVRLNVAESPTLRREKRKQQRAERQKQEAEEAAAEEAARKTRARP